MQPEHEPVARARPEVGPDVEAAGDRQQEQTPGEGEALRPPLGLLRQHPQAEVGHRADRERVGDRAEARPLLERDPEQQHHEAGEERDQAEAHPGVLREPLRQDVPRRDSDARTDHERDGEPVGEQSDEELEEATREEHDVDPIGQVAWWQESNRPRVAR
nr:hypothetical protein GCM10025699_75520 [Microbacterium flavescens]